MLFNQGLYVAGERKDFFIKVNAGEYSPRIVAGFFIMAKKNTVRPSFDQIRYGMIKTKRCYPQFVDVSTALNTTQYDLSNIVITYPFYARIKVAKTRVKQWYPVLYGRNNEIVFTGETHKNKNDVVQLIKSWFPQIEVKR